jgi:hypothetical protein
MSPLESALLFLVLALPAYWWMQRQIARDADPAYLRGVGVIVVLERALEARSAPIGQFMGHPVWENVTFKGMLYRFDRVIPARLKEGIGPGELFIAPGLVYVVQ